MPQDYNSYSRIFSPNAFREALLQFSGAEGASRGPKITDLPTFTPTD